MIVSIRSFGGRMLTEIYSFASELVDRLRMQGDTGARCVKRWPIAWRSV